MDQPSYHPIMTDVQKCVEEQYQTMWVPDEVIIGEDDKNGFEAMEPEAQAFLLNILAFFASADGLVVCNLVQNMLQTIKNPQVLQFYATQTMMEGIHAHTYSNTVQVLARDDTQRHELSNALHTLNSVKNKASWVIDRVNDELDISKRLVAFCLVEGLFFQGSFAAIFWLKERGYNLPGVFQSNHFIARDEQLHCDFAIFLYKKLGSTVSEKDIHSMVRSAVRCEEQFMEESLPNNMVGMSVDKMSKYIRFIADSICVCLSVSKIYNTPNPFTFMEKLAMKGRSNFFEKREVNYVGHSKKQALAKVPESVW